MSSPSSLDSANAAKRRRGILPPELVDLLTPALKVGAMTGGAGAVSGLAAGIIRDVPPALFAIASSIQWFTLGSTFWLTRSAVVKIWGGDDFLTARDKTKASAVAGGAAGMVGGLLRGPRNIVPGAIMFTIFGTMGQGAANKLDQWRVAEKGEEGSSWLRSQYSPLRKLTDEEYEDLIGEKMLKVEADIALIDDKIVALREEEAAKVKAKEGLAQDPGAAKGP